jgi:hypothetical protein
VTSCLTFWLGVVRAMLVWPARLRALLAVANREIRFSLRLSVPGFGSEFHFDPSDFLTFWGLGVAGTWASVG